MGFRRRSRWIGVALVVVLAIGVPLTAGAQARGAGGAQAPAGGRRLLPGGAGSCARRTGSGSWR